jgi:hypothetical protein
MNLCRLLGEPTPSEADPHGEFSAFENSGSDGFADSPVLTPTTGIWRRCRPTGHVID